MSNKRPLVGGLPISENRRDKIILEEIPKAFESNAIIRKMLKIKEAKKEDSEQFTKIGINSIQDRIWFVDLPDKQEAVYTSQGIGYHYSEGISRGENRVIANKILEIIKDNNKMRVIDKLTKLDVTRAVSKLMDKGFDKDIIIFTNIYDEFEFWHWSNFKGMLRSGGKPIGNIKINNKLIPVYDDLNIPKGTTLVLDKDKLGSLIIKKQLQADITDIRDDEKDKILENLPQLKKEDLSEKVRVYLDEVIRVEIENPEAIISIEHPIKG